MSSIDATAISRTRSPDLISGYRLEKLVGTGGMGEVHKATQLSLGRTVAVKLLNPELAKDPSFIARFQKEAAALATLSHPNIVTIVDKGKTESTYYLVMEFVDGPSLRELIRAPDVDVPGVLRRMLEICRAIEYAHSRGVVHRDLKPENILLDQQAGGIAKVTDFGLASFLDDASPSSRYALTSTHMSMGTLSYMAPEQRVDAKNADGRADLFSLGVILYEWLTGEVPLGTFDPPSRRRPEMDPRVDGIVTKCLKPDPADRYPSVAGLIADLEPLVPGSLPSMLPVKKLTRVQRLKLGARKVARTTLRVAEVAVVVSALAVLGVAWVRSGDRPKPVRQPGGAMLSTGMSESKQDGSGRKLIWDDKRLEGTLSLGEGPDTIALVPAGRPLEFSGKTLAFPPVEEDAPRVGRVRVDMTREKGDIVQLTASVSAEPPPLTLKRRLNVILHGDPPTPVAALALLGGTGRFVAIVHHGAGERISVEWELGERNGTMLGLEAPEGSPAELELSVDEEGVLQAFSGSGKDKRPITEPLDLGPGWSKQFGEAPVPAFGCIDGTCRAEGLTYFVKRLPPPPPATTPMVAVPPPPPVRTVAAVPTKAVTPARRPPPPPPKRQPAKAAPAKNGKRR